MNFKKRFIMKAIEDGWSVIKKNNTYVFTKQHHNIKEYFEPSYLHKFIKKYS